MNFDFSNNLKNNFYTTSLCVAGWIHKLILARVGFLASQKIRVFDSCSIVVGWGRGNRWAESAGTGPTSPNTICIVYTKWQRVGESAETATDVCPTQCDEYTTQSSCSKIPVGTSNRVVSWWLGSLGLYRKFDNSRHFFKAKFQISYFKDLF